MTLDTSRNRRANRNGGEKEVREAGWVERNVRNKMKRERSEEKKG